MRKLIHHISLVALIAAFSLHQKSPAEELMMTRLNNGLLLIAKRNRTNRILAAECFIRVGSAMETQGEEGLVNFTQSVLLKGTAQRTAQELAEEIEGIGGILNTGTAEDYATLSMIVLIDDLDKGLELMSDVLFGANFPVEEVEKERANLLALMRLREDSKWYLTYKHFRRLLYQGHPYAHLPEGTPETVKQISREALVRFHQEHYVPANMILSVVGDVEFASLKEKVERYFPAEEAQAPPLFLADKSFKPRRLREEIVREKEQGFIVLGFPTTGIESPDYVPLKVACAILGEGMSSRLFVNLRDKQGLAYSVGAGFPTKRLTSHLFAWIGTRAETLEAAKEGLLKEFQQLAAEGPTAEELERAKNYLLGTFLLDHQRNIKQAWYLGWYQTLGVGAQFDEIYPQLIKQVTAEEVRRVALGFLRSPAIVTLLPARAGETE